MNRRSTPVLRATVSKAGFDLPTKTAREKSRARRILTALYAEYPDARCGLNYSSPHELLVATILSAQATDVSVNQALPKLFTAFPSPEDFARATPAKIEPYIRTIGLSRMKARSIQESMTRVVEIHDGQVPNTMEDLIKLRGVARKTANVVLGNAFGINLGVVVDTHVMRIARRFSLTEHNSAIHIEKDLMALFSRPHWTMLSHLLIQHGRHVCKARGALCSEHPICRRYCDNAN